MGLALDSDVFELSEITEFEPGTILTVMCKEVCAFLSLLFKSFMIVYDLPMGASGSAIFPLSSMDKCRQKNANHPKKKQVLH